MTTLTITSAKLAIVLPAGKLPAVDPEDPRIRIDLDGTRIDAKINAKAARKLKVHPGAAVLQGRLIVEGGRLVLAEAGFSFLDPKPPLGAEDKSKAEPSSVPPAPKGAVPGVARSTPSTSQAGKDVYLTCREVAPKS